MEHTFNPSKPPVRFASREARRSSEASVVDVLDRDQHKILRLFEAISFYADGDDERLDFFGELRRELLAHLRAEEEVSWPVLVDGDPALLAELHAAHLALAEAVDHLARTPMGVMWKVQLKALRVGVVEHMKAERSALLPRAKQQLPLAQQMALGRAFEAARDRHLNELSRQC
ncbi:MAG: hemerythrin domain-containing protein [Myxococcota bacterium]